jgi:hypothetical protein
MAILGGVLFGVGYLGSVVGAIAGTAEAASENSTYGATCYQPTYWLYAPFVGGAVTAGTFPNHDLVGTQANGKPFIIYCRPAYTPIAATAVLSEVLQLSGAALLAVALVVRHRLAGSEPARARSPLRSILVLPAASPTGAGLTLTGAF